MEEEQELTKEELQELKNLAKTLKQMKILILNLRH